jgi:hypothetical protein
VRNCWEESVGVDGRQRQEAFGIVQAVGPLV